MVTTNFPMVFPYTHRWLDPLFESIGMELGMPRSRRSSKPSLGHCLPDKRGGERREHIVNNIDLKSVGPAEGAQRVATPSTSGTGHSLGITRQLEVVIWEEDARWNALGPRAKSGNYTAAWSGTAISEKPAKRSEYFADHVHQSSYTNI